MLADYQTPLASFTIIPKHVYTPLLEDPKTQALAKHCGQYIHGITPSSLVNGAIHLLSLLGVVHENPPIHLSTALLFSYFRPTDTTPSLLLDCAVHSRFTDPMSLIPCELPWMHYFWYSLPTLSFPLPLFLVALRVHPKYRRTTQF